MPYIPTIAIVFLNKHYQLKNKIYFSDKIYQFIFGVSPHIYKGKLCIFIIKEMLIETGFKEVWVLKSLFPMMYNC